MKISVSNKIDQVETVVQVNDDDITKELFNINMLAENGKLEGEFNNISNDAYHSHLCPADSRSTIMIARDSIAKYKAKKEGKMPWTTSPAKEFGSMCHEFILEPEEFKKNYADPYPIERPEGSATKLAKNGGCKEAYIEWKDDKAAYEASLGSRKIVSLKDMDKLTGMREALMSIDMVKDILSSDDIEFENTYFYTEKKTHQLMKFRTDIIIKSKKIIIDYKTTIDASPIGFSKSLTNFKYDVQAAQYLEGAEDLMGGDWTFGFIVQEKEFPYAVGLYSLSESDREIGQSILDDTRRVIATLPPMDEIKPAYSLNFKPTFLQPWAMTSGYR